MRHRFLLSWRTSTTVFLGADLQYIDYANSGRVSPSVTLDCYGVTGTAARGRRGAGFLLFRREPAFQCRRGNHPVDARGVESREDHLARAGDATPRPHRTLRR